MTADRIPADGLEPGRVILADKPPGLTSHDIVARVRRETGVKRVGHAGTLDPFATGLLIILIGRRATREQAVFMSLKKTYLVEARFGATSTTGDRDGEIIETGAVPDRLPPLATGEIRQRPPVYSAVKVAGQRAYRRARRGEEVEMPERLVTVHRFECLAWDPPRATFAVECSSGTYVRSLVADLGDAYCEELRRTAIGPFVVEEAAGGETLALPDALARVRAFETA